MLKRCVLRRSVLSQDFPNARLVTLSREKALNALNTSMVDQLATIHRTPHTNQDAHVYILKGAGAKAFCAGGDVVSIVKDTPPGTQAEFFYKEYQVDYHIMTMAQPQVALWDGIVMGGGVGVSIHGKYRVATEKALFAMPETGIGLFPDVGGSWFLPRLPSKQTGLYLSLTGLRLKGADLKHAGLATHYVASEHIAALEATLCNISSSSLVESVLDDFAARTALPAYSLADTTESGKLIAASFDANLTVEEIIEKLRTSGSEVGTKWAAGLLKCCPTALKVSRELFRRGAAITKPADIFAMEYCATQRAMSHGDFARGVTALLIDKTGNPVWSPATLDAVSDELVDSHFTASPNAKKWDPITPYAS